MHAGWPAILLVALTTGPLSAREISSANFIGPTDSYDHGILGDAIEYSGLMIRMTDGARFIVGFSENNRVFEDIAPRLWDVTGDGKPEVVVIETDPPRGAQLAIYGLQNDTITKIAETPHIGRTHRWLAPIGATDLDGDGHIEIAYIDRPHLARTLRIWRFENNTLTHVADQPGVTNHRIGEDHISGGIRHCAGPPEIITVNPDWSRLIASTLSNGRITTRDIGRHTGPDSFAIALNCR